jgi:hypothetical protein
MASKSAFGSRSGSRAHRGSTISGAVLEAKNLVRVMVKTINAILITPMFIVLGQEGFELRQASFQRLN